MVLGQKINELVARKHGYSLVLGSHRLTIRLNRCKYFREPSRRQNEHLVNDYEINNNNSDKCSHSQSQLSEWESGSDHWH